MISRGAIFKSRRRGEKEVFDEARAKGKIAEIRPRKTSETGELVAAAKSVGLSTNYRWRATREFDVDLISK